MKLRHIELLGPPGSGKSTVAAALIGVDSGLVSLDQAAWMALCSTASDSPTRAIARLTRSPSSRLWRWTYARSPDRFAALGRAVGANADLVSSVAAAQFARSGRDSHPDVVWDWFLNLLARFQLAKEALDQGGSLLLDEGFCQRAVAIFGLGHTDQDEFHLERYVRHIPVPDVVIHVDTATEVCRSRLDQRGWTSRLNDVDAESRAGFLSASVEITDLVARRMEERGASVLSVDGTAPLDVITGQLTSAVGGEGQ